MASAAIACIRGISCKSIAANDQAVFERFCIPKSEILAMASADIDANKG